MSHDALPPTDDGSPPEQRSEAADTADDRDPVERIAAEFAELCRRGERVSIEDFVGRYPDVQDELLQLLPMVAAMERRSLNRNSSSPPHVLGEFPLEQLDDFVIEREIGRGGMGVVYEAQQISLERKVALKVLSRRAFGSEKGVRRFHREAQTAARLHHTNIVPVFGVGEQHGIHYIVMQIIDGVGLDEVWSELRRLTSRDADGDRDLGSSRQSVASRSALALLHGELRQSPSSSTSVLNLLPHLERASSADNNESLPPRANMDHESGGAADANPSGTGDDTSRALPHPTRSNAPLTIGADYFRNVARIGVQIGQALAHAHAHGTLHRDIKPANLLLDKEGLAWVADFGLAKAREDQQMTWTGDVVGTLRYMAPERLDGIADVRSDIYSLGITLYELLTLENAFEANERSSLLQQIAEGRLIAPRKRLATIPRDLDSIILKATAPVPSDRYDSAGQLASDLQSFLAGRPIQLRRASAAERLWRWSLRNRSVAALATAALCLLILVAALSTALYVRESQRRAEVEATVQVAADVLDRIYLAFAPPSDVTSVPLAEEDIGEQLAPLTSLQPAISRDTALVLENMLVFYDRIAKPGIDDMEILRRSAVAIRRVGDIHQQLEQLDQAQDAYQRAIGNYIRLVAAKPTDVGLRLEMARLYNDLGNVVRQRRLVGSLRPHQRAWDSLQVESVGLEPSDAVQFERARTLYYFGRWHAWSRRDLTISDPFAREHPLEACTQILEGLIARHALHPEYRLLLARVHLASGFPGSESRSVSEQKAIEILTTLVEQFPHVSLYRYELASIYARVSYRRQSEPLNARTESYFQETETRLRKALEISAGIARENPNNPRYYQLLTRVHSALANVLIRRGAMQDAQEHLRTTVALQQTLVGLVPDDPQHQIWLGLFQIRLAEVQLECGDWRQAQELIDQASVAIEAILARPDSGVNRLTRRYARDAIRNAQSRLERGEKERADTSSSE